MKQLRTHKWRAYSGFAKFILVCSTMLGAPVSALQLEFPARSSLVRENVIALGSHHLPVSPWSNGDLETVLTKGEVTQQAWKIAATDLTSLQIMQPLKQQLSDAGFEIIFECKTQECGGFDFRFQIDVMPEPAMHINLGDFRFLSARKPDQKSTGDTTGETTGETAQYISLLVSRSRNAGYIQLTRIGAASATTTLITSTKNPDLTTRSASDILLERALEQHGFFILHDLVFKTGSSDLSKSEFDTLGRLADYLAANPTRTVALVGHTDSQGSLEANIALSQRRAESVRQRLIGYFNVNKDQLIAKGNGFLAPVASNMTKYGRAQNRRVEVIITSTQ